jgi:hypothetical protein
MSLTRQSFALPKEPNEGSDQDRNGHREAMRTGVDPRLIPRKIRMFLEVSKAIEEIVGNPNSEDQEEPARPC